MKQLKTIKKINNDEMTKETEEYRATINILRINSTTAKNTVLFKIFKKKKIIYILSTTEQVFYLEKYNNGKLLSNCNSNCRGQPSGWIGWLLPSCTLCTYRDPKLRQLDKKRSSPIIILLYSVWYFVRIWAQQIKNSIFNPSSAPWYALFEPLKR